MSGMRRLDEQRADAQSRDTTYSGLPKTIKLVNFIAQGPAAGSAWSTISYGGGAFGAQHGAYNYGGYAYTTVGGNPSQVIIPEPGIYQMQASWNFTTAAEVFLGWVWGGTGGGAVPTLYAGQDQRHAGAFPSRNLYSTELEMGAGDTIIPAWFSTAGLSVPNDGTCWYSVTKLSGQY